MDGLLFPYDSVRPIQNVLVDDISKAIGRHGCHIAHAPTGLGKTAAALAPALTYARQHDKVVFFLTSRHTQHTVAINTLRDIKHKHDISIPAIDIIGRQSLCPVENIDKLFSREFSEYCKTMKEDGKCKYYRNTKKNATTLMPKAKEALVDLNVLQPFHAEQLLAECKASELCPYEISVEMARKAQVIVADYYYIFSPSIRETFLGKLGKTLNDVILVVDEGHNLPNRIRELMTYRLTSRIISAGRKEAAKYGFSTLAEFLDELEEAINGFAKGMTIGKERLVKKGELTEPVSLFGEYEEIVDDLEKAAEHVREKQRQSFLGSIGNFLEGWLGEDTGFARILKVMEQNGKSYLELSYKCLDPSILSQEVFVNTHSTILMSGTLTPTTMYREVLGFPSNTTEAEYDSPFAEKNKLVLVNPTVTTKYSERSNAQFEKIAKICSEMTNQTPGNSAIFFPSYGLKKLVANYFQVFSTKTVIEEHPGFTKAEKEETVAKFKSYSKSGAVLLGVAAGSFGEGIDLPGDLLKCVIVVGLPLQPPTLEVKELIAYFDKKMGKGWDYGYTLPAIATSLQNAGRCIRTENDRGVIAFLDRRFALPQYAKCFPHDWNVKTTTDHVDMIAEFFLQM